MNRFLPAWLDQFLRRHPVMLLLVLGVLIVLSFGMLIAESASSILVYQGF